MSDSTEHNEEKHEKEDGLIEEMPEDIQAALAQWIKDGHIHFSKGAIPQVSSPRSIESFADSLDDMIQNPCAGSLSVPFKCLLKGRCHMDYPKCTLRVNSNL